MTLRTLGQLRASDWTTKGQHMISTFYHQRSTQWGIGLLVSVGLVWLGAPLLPAPLLHLV